MDPSKFGPFASVVAIVAALSAVFSLVLLRALGNINRWTWLTDDSPSFIVTAAARIAAIVSMALAFVAIGRGNSLWFAAAALVLAALAFVAIARFDRLRKVNVMAVPLVGENGSQLSDSRGRPLFKNVAVGSEAQLMPDAAEALKEARRTHGGLSLRQFMAGYGSTKLNDPEALWDRDLLATISSRLTVTLMLVTLFGVVAVFLAALVVDVSIRI